MQAPIAVNGTEVVDLTLRNSLREEIDDDIDIDVDLDTYLELLQRIGKVPTYIGSYEYEDAYITLECKSKYRYTYPVGGHMVKHTDTIKGDNHIGTLVIVEKAADEGGDLEMTDYYDGSHVRIDDAYRDGVHIIPIGVEHEVTPVIKGTRVTLVYDIFATDDTTSIETAPPVVSLASEGVSITVNKDGPWDTRLINKYTSHSRFVVYPNNPDIVESLIIKMITETYEVIRYQKGIVIQEDDKYTYDSIRCGIIGKLDKDIYEISQYNDHGTTHTKYYLANIMELKK